MFKFCLTRYLEYVDATQACQNTYVYKLQTKFAFEQAVNITHVSVCRWNMIIL